MPTTAAPAPNLLHPVELPSRLFSENLCPMSAVAQGRIVPVLLTAARRPTLSGEVVQYIGGRSFLIMPQSPKAVNLVLSLGDSFSTCARLLERCGSAFEKLRFPRGPLGATCDPLREIMRRSRHNICQGTHPECIQVHIATTRCVADVVFALSPVTTAPLPLFASGHGPTWWCSCAFVVRRIASSRHRHRDPGAVEAPLLRIRCLVVRCRCWGWLAAVRVTSMLRISSVL